MSKPIVCLSVEELIAALQKFPKDLPVNYPTEEGMLVVLFNEGRPDVFVGIEPNDGTFEEDYGDAE